MRRHSAHRWSKVTALSVVGVAHDLTEAYVVSEEIVPELILIEQSLTLGPEFASMVPVFNALDIRWLIMRGRTRNRAGFDTDSTEQSVHDNRIALPRNVDGLINRIIAFAGPPEVKNESPPAPPKRNINIHNQRLALVGASTGGVDALMTILADYPADCPPTVIVQHTGADFGSGLVRLLDRNCAARVSAAEHGAALEPGTVSVATSSEHHLEIVPGRPVTVALTTQPRVSGHRPSVDVMFRSAVPLAKRAVGLLLTGMGHDGAQGLLELRNAGAHTIAQGEKSSVVYGMPRVAWEIGAAGQRLEIKDIGAELLKRCVITR